jgi:F0F1-type ATP synthase assembly protein I
MIGLGLATLIRFLIGIFLLQGVTALLVYTALGSDWQTTWPLYLVLAVSIGTLVGLWFSAIVGADRRHAVARVSERLSKEREEIRVKAEQQRIKDARNQERLVAKASAASKAGGIGRGLTLKSGVVVGGAVGVGVAMLLTQFVTLGLLTLTTAGGAALGYGARVRQEKLIAGRRIDSDRREVSVIPAKETPLTIGGRGGRSRPAEQS